MLKLADELGGTIAALERMNALMQQLVGTTHHMVGVTKETAAITAEVRDDIADFDDTFRPLRSYFYAEPHCYNIPVCWAIRSLYNAMDGVDKLSEKLDELGQRPGQYRRGRAAVGRAAAAADRHHEKPADHGADHCTAPCPGCSTRQTNSATTRPRMGKDFDAAKTDDSFYLPREAFDNPDFQRIMKLFLSPDGKAARFIISHKGDPATDEGMSRIDAIRTAAYESLKGTSLEDSKIYISGTAAIFKDLREASHYDFMIAGISVALHDLHHHVDHHAKSCRRLRHCGYGGAFVGGVVWTIRAALAILHRR